MPKQPDKKIRVTRELAKSLNDSLTVYPEEGWGFTLNNDPEYDRDCTGVSVNNEGMLVFSFGGKKPRELVLQPVAWRKPEQSS